MSKEEFKNIDITFRYETYLSSNKEEKIIKDYKIIKEGLFNHYNLKGDDIRNINFYNYYNKNRDSNNDLTSTLINHTGYIKLPFTSNYITFDNLNYVITNDTEKKKLTLDDILENLDIDMYKDLLNRNFNDEIIRNIDNYIYQRSEKNIKHFKDFFGQGLTIDNFKLILTEYTYLDFFKNYADTSKRNIFDKNIKSYQKNPIDNLIISQLNQKYKSEIEKLTTEKSIFSKFKDNNYENFFKIEKNSNLNHLIDYFNKIKENFEENFKKDSEEIRGEFYSKLPKLNRPKEFKDILYKYGKYFVNENDYKTNNSPENFYKFIRADKTLINKIITYYNIYTILNEIYIVRDSIIYSNEEFSKEVNNNKYKKIKKIIPTKQLPHISFNNEDNLKCYFNVEFENTNNNSIVRFNTNLINIEKQLIDNNKSRKKYINYGTNLFDKNINKKDILVSKDIDLNSFKYDFDSLLNKNIEIFKTKKPKNSKEIFFDNDLFNYVLTNYEKKNNNFNDFFNDLVNKIFFYKNPENILYNNNKFYIVDNVQIVKLNELKENKVNIEKFKEKLKEKESQQLAAAAKKQAAEEAPEEEKKALINSLENEFPQLKDEIANYINKDNKLKENYDFLNNIYSEFKSSDLRLQIDDKDSRYEIYLDVVCYIKNSLDEKISLKKKMSCNFNCYNSANNLDNLFKILLKQYFDDDSFKKMLNPNTKSNMSIIDSNIKEELKEDIKDKVNEDIKDKVNEDIKKIDTLVNGGKKNKKSNYYFKKIKKNNNKYIKKTLKNNKNKNKNKNKNTLKLRKLIKYYLKNY